MRSRWFAVLALVIVGLVWVGQGTGLITGSSFMVGDPRWAIAGGVMVALGILIGVSQVIRRPKA